MENLVKFPPSSPQLKLQEPCPLLKLVTLAELLQLFIPYCPILTAASSFQLQSSARENSFLLAIIIIIIINTIETK